MNEPQYDHLNAHITRLVKAALAAADPAVKISENLRLDGGNLLVGPYRYQLKQGRIFLLAVGKAAMKMGRAAVRVLGDRLHAGIIITKRPADKPAGAPRLFQTAVVGKSRVDIYEAGHPITDESSLTATAAVKRMLKQTESGDLLLALISGGTSALLSSPVVPPSAWHDLTEALLKSGCTIEELNCVRRLLDEVKGGGLAVMAAPAATAGLILSDVVGNSLSAIGSGPTVETLETPTEAFEILHRYNIGRKLAPDYRQEIEHALAAAKPSYLNEIQVVNLIIGDVREAGEACAAEARKLGFAAQLLTAHLQGEASEVGRVAAALAIDAREGQCLIMGGETTVTVRGDGVGGRNQELALSAAVALRGQQNVAVLSFATDGEDGPTDAAGAFATGELVELGRRIGLDPADHLRRNDSHTFFVHLANNGPDYLLRTGPTGTNVNDLVVVLKYPKPAAGGDSVA